MTSLKTNAVGLFSVTEPFIKIYKIEWNVNILKSTSSGTSAWTWAHAVLKMGSCTQVKASDALVFFFVINVNMRISSSNPNLATRFLISGR